MVSRICIVDQFYDHVDVLVLQEYRGIGSEVACCDAPFLVRVFDTDLFNECLQGGRGMQYIVQALTHHAKTEEADGEFIR